MGRQAWQVMTVNACYLTERYGEICSAEHCLTHAVQTPPRVPHHSYGDECTGTSGADASANLTHPLCVCQGTLQIVQLLQGLRASHQRLRMAPQHTAAQHAAPGQAQVKREAYRLSTTRRQAAAEQRYPSMLCVRIVQRSGEAPALGSPESHTQTNRAYKGPPACNQRPWAMRGAKVVC